METRREKPIIAIVGETASGKTATAIKLAKAINGEIICADSRTVYKFMDIGTAKPTKDEQAEIIHHLIDLVEPNISYNVAQFQLQAKKCIQEIKSRGKVPIIVGGTGLYIDALLYNFQFKSSNNIELRQKLEQMNDEELTTLLNTKNIDISKLDTKNRRRVIRAIEKGNTEDKRESLSENTVIFGIKLDKDILNKRISQRVEEMFMNGLIEEVKILHKKYGTNLEALKTPGYKAINRYLSGEIDIFEAKKEFMQADLKLAKRQRTWFKRSKDIEWFEDPKQLINSAIAFIEKQRV